MSHILHLKSIQKISQQAINEISIKGKILSIEIKELKLAK